MSKRPFTGLAMDAHEAMRPILHRVHAELGGLGYAFEGEQLSGINAALEIAIAKALVESDSQALIARLRPFVEAIDGPPIESFVIPEKENGPSAN